MLIAQGRTEDIVSLTGRPWTIRPADDHKVMTFSQKFHIPEVLARILVARGVEMDEVEWFLNPSLKTSLPDPSHLLDMDAAADRVAAAVTGGETLAVFGDYDVDGATSSALLMRYFRALGLAPLVHIPDRIIEGYGPNTPALLGLQQRGATLVITVDCGTMAFDPLEDAHNAGLDVIVVDHHIGDVKRPMAYAVVNPNRLDEGSPHGQLAAVGVAFLLMVAVNRKLRDIGWFLSHQEPDLRQWLDLVALGTICDVVPLTYINRALVAQGLKVMSVRRNLGISTLLDLAAVSEVPGVYTCGFVLGPRINAGGRVGKSDLGVRLLTTEDGVEALSLARELELHNAERKAIESMVLEQAMQQAETHDPDSPIMMVAGHGWHPGVIGIVAGRLKERFHKPVAVVAVEGGVCKASARSIPGVDLGAAVIAAKEYGLLIAGGGHAMAAGFTVEEANLHELSQFLSQRIVSRGMPANTGRQLTVDGAISIGGASAELVSQLERLGPFGQGNPSIRMVIEGVINLRPEPVGEHHVKTFLIDNQSNVRLSAIAFRCRDTKLGEALLTTRGRKVNVAGQLRLQEWNGRQTVSLMIDDIALAG